MTDIDEESCPRGDKITVGETHHECEYNMKLLIDDKSNGENM